MSRDNSGRATPEAIDWTEKEIDSLAPPSLPNITIVPSAEDAASTQTTSVAGMPISPKEIRALRKHSPARLPTELIIKVQSQRTRIGCMNAIASTVPGNLNDITLIDIEADLGQIEELHREFAATHTHFELHWPAAFLDHSYFAENFQQQEATAYRLAKAALNKAKAALLGPPQASATHATPETRHDTKLPDIALPSFSGKYADWPQFRELFKCLILDNERITSVEKLHYLRSCMEAGPAQLIANFPLVSTSLQPSWELLIGRYENKRLLIQAQLDKLCNLTPLTSKSASGLAQLIAAVSEGRKALESLGVTENLGEIMLVHHVSQHLDRSTREAWETSLGASLEYPKFTQLEEFINTRARALERIEASTSATQQAASRSQSTRRTATAHQASSTHQQEQKATQYHCDCCDGNHFIVLCSKFRNLDISARRRVATTQRLCFNCLGRHNANSCKSTKGCKQCGARHHSMLHESSANRAQSSNSSTHEPTASTSSTTIAVVHSSTATHHVRLLIDPGSELTFVSERLTHQLNLHRHHSSIPILGIGGKRTTQTRGVTALTLCSTHTSAAITVQAHILTWVSSVLPSFHARNQTWPHITKLKLADPEFLDPRPIDIIIGADAYGQVIKPNIIKHSPSMPIAQLSIFGWLILGPVHSTTSPQCHIHHVKVDVDNGELQNLLSKFWVQEELPNDNKTALTPEEQECEQHFRTTHSRDATGRYIVRIPLKSSLNLLGNSQVTAHHCLRRMLKRLQQNEQLKELYTSFMTEYAMLGHMTRAPTHPTKAISRDGFTVGTTAGEMTLAPDALKASGGSRVSSGGLLTRSHPVYYLPHHSVLKPDSSTTKLRVVFNGSSPTTSGHSLNDLMHTGPNLLLEIADVLTWIRHHRHIFATDITKMYRQVKVHKDDWNLQRILWIDDALNEVPYQLTTVTYGTKAAPFLAVRALMQLVEDEGHRFPLAVPSLTKGRYVDDIFGGADSLTHLIKIAQELKDLCNAGGFPLSKWQSTREQLCTAVSSTQEPTRTISFDDCSTKILGIKWLPKSDVFVFSANLPDHSRKITKRLILSEVAQIFDPLGFISPVTIRAKVLLQELWLHKLDWDESLPHQLTTRWLNIREDLKNLAKISIPRWFNTWSNSTVELHGFSDASQLAMSAVVYIVVHSTSTGAKSALVCAKTKVAPLKQLTIPRLELSAALLLSKLVKHSQATLQLPITSTHLWTDSQVTLMWIKAPASRWKDYVRNRVTQIQDLTVHAHWRHVPGTSNPADGPSRGLTAQQLKDHSLWWTGPPWMTKSMNSWPRQTQQLDDLAAQEARPGVALFVAAPKLEYHWDLIYRYSSLNKLIRITALCFKFIARLKKQLNPPPATFISGSEMEAAKIFWVKATQAVYFSHELNTLKSHTILPRAHVLSRLTAFLDHEGVIRVGGRLNLSSLSYETKHPAILPRHSQLSSLIIDHSHRRTLHRGTQLTLADTRQSYWILGGRAPVKTHILHCVTCARQRGIRAQQLMGQLPIARVTPARPFSHAGLDYAGPLVLKTWKGRGAKSSKGWICVFVCLTTSAVHLEAVSDYSSDGFLATYRRFVSRRGIPSQLYSDCGTNLVGADAALKRMFTQSTHEHKKIASILSDDCTQWSFNPPAAPHMGGKWEAAVKSIKFHLRRTVGETVLTFEELTTLLSQIEAVLNSRPLEPLSDDPEDVSALTPGHFLTGSALSSLPEASLADANINRLTRWQLIQQKFQHFWTHWTAHYLQRQQSISKWHHPSHDIKVGSLVLITDERFPPSKWPLARVTALHPGADGLTRVVTLKTATTTLTRPIAKLSILPSPHGTSTQTGTSPPRR